MAVIKCKECGKEMSDTLDACPHCGYKGDIEEDSKEKEQTEEVKQRPPVGGLFFAHFFSPC